MKKRMVMMALCLACLAHTSTAVADFTTPHNWQLRLRAIDVAPDESSTTTNGGIVHADSTGVPELDISYFFTDNISAELILATSKHNMSETSPNINLGSVWVLPPTLTAQYHFNNTSSFVPYVGAGINYTVFYNAKPGAATNINYEDGFGYALQAGTDYKLDEHWMLNFDVKKILLNTDVSVSNGAVLADVDLDPWVIGMGIGYRF